MGAKRKASGGGSAKTSPVSKKAKVVDPVVEHVNVIIDALNSDTGSQLPEGVVQMLENIVKPALSNSIETRHGLESKFAQLVGEALQTAAQSLGKAADDTATAHTEQQGAAAAAAATLEAAKAAVEAAQAALNAAVEAKDAADDAEEAAEKAVSTHEKEHKDLEKTRAKYESEVETLQTALDVVQSPTSHQKDGKKVQAVLKSCGASGSVVDALPQSLGQTEGFATLVLSEAAKSINTRKAEVSNKLANWEGYVASISQTAETLANNVVAAKELVATRTGAVQGANDGLKAAKAEQKSADAESKSSAKAVDAKKKAASAAEGVKDSATGALASFQFLYNRSDAAPPVNGDEVEINGAEA